MDQITFWIVLAAVCILMEFLVPGAVLGFLGLGAALVAAALHLGWIEGWFQALTAFFMGSIFLVLVLRTMFLKIIPGDSKVENVDEDEDAKGAIVEVVEDISPSKRGRIRYRESTWEAESDEYITRGSKALIVSRAGNRWVVQSLIKGVQ